MKEQNKIGIDTIVVLVIMALSVIAMIVLNIRLLQELLDENNEELTYCPDEGYETNYCPATNYTFLVCDSTEYGEVHNHLQDERPAWYMSEYLLEGSTQ